MKSEYFDLDCSDDECSHFLRKAFHAPFDAFEEVPDFDERFCPHDRTCLEEFGMCQDSLFCKGPGSAAAFVKQFDRALVDNSVKVGDLLLLTAEQSSESKMFFLGVCTKRPTAHILLHAHIDNGGMCAFSANESGHLEISTSHAMFHKILSHARAAVKEMRVEVWSYVVIHGQEAPFIRVESVDLLKSFTVNLDTKHVKRKPHFKLPFGFKIRKKKKQQHRPKPKPRAKARAELKTSKSADVATDSDREHLASSSSSDSRTGLLNAANGQSEPSSIDGVESEIRPVSELAKQEEATADLLIAEHEACKSAASTAATAVLAYEQKSSFFAKEVGLHEAAIAVSGRSVCYFCKEKIPKGSVRFSYHHSRLRPSNWVHATCLVGLARKEKCEQQVSERLRVLSNDFRSKSQSSESDFPALAAAAQQSLQQLQAEPS